MSTNPTRRDDRRRRPAPAGPVVLVRNATVADHAAVRAVLRLAYAQYLPVLGPVLHRIYLDDLCALEHRLDGATLLVATIDDVAVGTVTFHLVPPFGELPWPEGWSVVRALGVAPDGRGHGIAERLMAACLELAAGGGASTLGLHTADFMTAAVRLYERMGFERVPSLDVDAASLVDAGGQETPVAIAYGRPLEVPVSR
jgi:GNAT superfamily N-acetyltransferase